MARIINTKIDPIVNLVVRTIFTDGTQSDMNLKKDDIVTDLRYIKDREMHKITGRVSYITYKVNDVRRSYGNVLKAKSYFSVDVTPVSILIDRSTTQHADVVEIPVMDIVENEGVANVKRMKTFLTYGMHSTVTLTDNTVNEFSILEGQILKDFVYLNKTEEPMNAKVVALIHDAELNPTSIVIVSDGKIYTLPTMLIKSIGSASDPVAPTADIGAIIGTQSKAFLAEGVFTTPLSISKSIVIQGAKAGIRADLKTRDIETFKDETVLSGTFKISAGAKVELDGVVLTKDALLSLGDASEVKVKNCIITGLNPNAANSFVISTANATPIKLEVRGCYFGDNKKTNFKFKNTFELNAKLKDGSVIENNYFTKECATNNDICIYNVEDNSTITIKNNVWEHSANGIRIGTNGDPICTINVLNNTYQSTDTAYPKYAGLLLVEPYDTQTTGMSRIKINMEKTTHYDKLQLYYLSSVKSEMPFTANNMPTITVDGVKQDLTKYISKPR